MFCRLVRKSKQDTKAIRNFGVHLISRKKIEFIAHNFKVSRHAYQRICERSKQKNIRKMILNSPLSWQSSDGFINIATDLFHYLVLAEFDNTYLIITYQDKSINGYSVVDKFCLSYMGLERKNKIYKGDL